MEASPGGAPAMPRAAFPWRAVIVVAGLAVALLLLYAGAYGFHRDELYFIVAGRHPDWGFVDQPAITPLLSAGAVALFGLSPTAIRVLPALVMALSIGLTAATARELGGSRRAQVIAAIVVAVSPFLLAGHLDSTETYDLLAWTVVPWLVVRLLGGADPREWLLVGLVAGIALENKHLILFLGAGLAVGLLVARRTDLLRSPWVWAAAAIALVLWLPNLAWQAAHDWPQLEMARAISAGSGSENRVLLLPMQLLFIGPLLFPIGLAGLDWLARSPEAKPWRPVAWTYLAVLALLLVSGGKGYYTAGLIVALVAAGSIRVDRWLGRGRMRPRAALLGSAVVGSFAIVAPTVLPILPPASLASTPINGIDKEQGAQIGWPELVAAVESARAQLNPAERGHAAIVTQNYGEAGALELLGDGALPVYSGHNSFYDFGSPPDRVTAAVVVGFDGYTRYVASLIGSCTLVTRFDNGFDLDTDEQGVSISICRGPLVSWARAWPLLRSVG